MIQRLRKTKLVAALLALGLLVSSIALAAWPNTPLTTYVANTTPAIKAADLNAWQNAINALVNPTTIAGNPNRMYSLAAVTVDGTGGNSVTPVAGSVVASRAVNSTTFPTPGTDLVAGEMTRDSVPAGMAHVKTSVIPPELWAGHGIHTVTRAAVGDYTVTFRRLPSGADARKSVVTVTGVGTLVMKQSVVLGLDAGNRLTARVLFDAAAADPDGFMITAWIF